MYFLAVDTATNSGGVALSRNNEVIGLAMLKTPLRYSDKLIYYIDFLLGQLEMTINEIDCFVVASGPGSFTGLRIGIATVKGLCQGLQKPGLGISTLEALAYRFRLAGPLVAPMIDARRQQVYGAVYSVNDRGVQELSEGVVLPPADWLKRLPPEDCVFVGDAAQMYKTSIAAFRPEAKVVSSDNCILTELCQLGCQRFIKGEAAEAEGLAARYIRPSDAEMAK